MKRDDLISRAAAIEAVLSEERYCERNMDDETTAAVRMARFKLEKAPVVDAAPVVHGEWMTDGDVMWCSVCKMPLAKTRITGATGRTHFIHIKTTYYPNCGARNMEDRNWAT